MYISALSINITVTIIDSDTFQYMFNSLNFFKGSNLLQKNTTVLYADVAEIVGTHIRMVELPLVLKSLRLQNAIHILKLKNNLLSV